MPNTAVPALPDYKRITVLFLSLAITINVLSQTHTPITTSISPNIQGYWEYLPADYATSNKTYPLLLFFHGKAERGNGSQTDLQLVLTYGPPKVINDGAFPKSITVDGQSYSFIVISPQLQNTAIETAQDYNILLNYIRHHYRIDDSRIYLTGLSLGAGRILYSASSSMSNANAVAGLVAASTDWSDDTLAATNIAASNLPVWLATNTQDPTIPYTYTLWWNNFLKAYSPPMNPQPLLDTFGVYGHDSWTQLFDPNFRPRGVNVYEWLLQYTRGADTVKTNVYPYISVPDTVTLPVGSITLDGSASSTDSGALIISYKWKVVSGPPGYVLSNSTSPVATLTKLSKGTYAIQLTASNNKGISATSNSLVVTVQGPRPLSVVQAPPSIQLPVDSVTLDGSASYDPLGTIASYNWSCISGNTGYVFNSTTSKTVKVSKLVAGVYDFVLKVINNRGYESSDTVSVVVKNATVTGPVAVIRNPGLVAATSVKLDASASYSATGRTISKWDWNYISGPRTYVLESNTGPIVKVSNLVSGTYTFQVKVSDTKGSGSGRVTFTVNPSATNIHAVITGLTSITLPLDSVFLDGSSSTSSNGNISYNWVVLSGPAGYTTGSIDAALFKMTKMKTGTYKVVLTTKNGTGLQDADTTAVTVNSSGPTVQAVINAPGSITLPVDSVALDGSASTSSNGGLVYNWRVVSGPAGYVLGNQTVSVFKISKMAAGTYVFMLTVNNATGQRDSTTATVVVNPAATPTVHAVINAPGSITLPVDSVALDGSASTSSNGGLVYNWRVVSGPAGYILGNQTVPVFKVSKMAAGTYVFILTVNNATGQRDSTTSTVIVNPAATPTVHAVINAPASITLPVDSVALDGSGSTSSNGGLIYNWRVVSGPAGYVSGNQTVPVFKVSKMAAGMYLFSLAVSNGTGQKDSTTATVAVNQAAATGPVAVIVNPGTVTTSSVTLDASGSYTVPGRTITSWLWNYMSGPKNAIIVSPTQSITNVTNLTNGTYTYRVKVTDKGGSNSQTVTFTVALGAGGRVANGEQLSRPEISLDVNEPNAQPLKLSPVPTNDLLNLSIVNTAKGKVTVHITDMSGRVVLRKDCAEKRGSSWAEKLDISSLAGGSYFVTVLIDNEKFSGKFIKLGR